jgi:hypothetical protein
VVFTSGIVDDAVVLSGVPALVLPPVPGFLPGVGFGVWNVWVFVVGDGWHTVGP